jgi:hypothetical protein
MKPYNRSRFLKITEFLRFFFTKSRKEQTPLKGKYILLRATQTVPLQFFSDYIMRQMNTHASCELLQSGFYTLI